MVTGRLGDRLDPVVGVVEVASTIEEEPAITQRLPVVDVLAMDHLTNQKLVIYTSALVDTTAASSYQDGVNLIFVFVDPGK